MDLYPYCIVFKDGCCTRSPHCCCQIMDALQKGTAFPPQVMVQFLCAQLRSLGNIQHPTSLTFRFAAHSI
eukprot:scaffold107535_cov21-Tisochrysis_lutea.AAC.1